MHILDPITLHIRIDTIHQKALIKLGIISVRDMLYHLPIRYEDISNIQSVNGLTKGQHTVVFGCIGGLKTRKAWKSKVPIGEGWIEDGSARIKVMWFNQPYLAKMLQNGMCVKLAGKVTGTEGKLYIANPEIEKLESLPLDRQDTIFNKTEHLDETLYPVYRETKGITSKWFFHTIQKCFERGILDTLEDPIPQEILKKYNLPTLRTALLWIHTPKKKEHTQSARKRFAFEEVFYIQITKAQERIHATKALSYQFKTEQKHIEAFTKRFPFTLTHAQQKSLDDIFADFNKPHPMSRLLEGDVGSGKTAVAATAAYAIATSMAHTSAHTLSQSHKKNNPKISAMEFGNLQVAYMAPTEILAKQHFESFIEYFHHLPIQIGLITGSGCKKFPSKTDPTKSTSISKTQLLKWVKNGEIPILIGTHALMYANVEFKRLALTIIDEQHRFGTNQRKALAKKDAHLPHLLSMTATPIPRTLALTIYGDLDITLLDQMPTGRKPVITTIVTSNTRDAMYQRMHTELAAGRQAYVICPRIEEPDPEKETARNVISVTEEAKHLTEKIFTTYRIGIVHSKMKPAEKEKIMTSFTRHEIDILVATSVIEVGVNIPNATIIVIEGAHCFGLAQLHQLRGRVIRGMHQAYCFVVHDSKNAKTKERLTALTTAKNGFELAEYDRTFRGSGQLYGIKQSGLTDLGMDAIKNIKLVEAARTEARALVTKDIELANHPYIREKIAYIEKQLHME
jgi:ATP-dependent DNA helicase RecG